MLTIFLFFHRSWADNTGICVLADATCVSVLLDWRPFFLMIFSSYSRQNLNINIRVTSCVLLRYDNHVYNSIHTLVLFFSHILSVGGKICIGISRNVAFRDCLK